MRIILTKNGKIVINQIEKEKNKSYKNIRLFKGSTLSPNFQKSSNKNLFKRKLLMSNSSGRIKYISSQKILINDFFNRDDSKINEKELELAKKIDISKPKISINQKYLDKYQDSDNEYKEKIKSLTNLLKPIKEKDINDLNQNTNITINPYKYKEKKSEEKIISSNFSYFNKNIKFGDIISNSNKIKLKSFLTKEYKGHNDIRVPLDNNNKDSFNFRSKYENKNAINDNLNTILESSIKSDKTSLIKYIKNANSFSPYLRKLINFDKTQIFKLNQVCGLMNKTKNKSFSEKKTIKNVKYKTIEKSKSSNILIPLLNKTNKILNNYSEYQELQTQRRKNMYKQILKNIKKKYWSNLHLGKMSLEISNGFDDSIKDYYIYV